MDVDNNRALAVYREKKEGFLLRFAKRPLRDGRFAREWLDNVITEAAKFAGHAATL